MAYKEEYVIKNFNKNFINKTIKKYILDHKKTFYKI